MVVLTDEEHDTECPDCGGTSVPILFGYPDPSAWEAAETGLIALGGCIVDFRVNRQCRACGHSFLGADDVDADIEAALVAAAEAAGSSVHP